MADEDQLKALPGVGIKIFRKYLQGQEGKELFRKTKKVLIKVYNLRHIYYLSH